MTTQTKGRNGMLKRLFGKSKADKMIEALQDLESAAVSAGVERKELNFDKNIYQSMLKALSKKKGILEEMKTAVDEMIAKVTDEAPEGLSNEIIATVMGFLSQVDGGEEVVEDVVEEEEATGDEMPVPDEEEEEAMEFVKTLLKENSALHEDVKALAELVPAFVGMATSMKQLIPLVESSSKVDALVADMAKMQKAIAARPRAASKDNGNVVDDEKVLAELKKGTDGKDDFFGVRLASK